MYFKVLSLTEDEHYGTKEEARVIIGSEQKTAKALKEIKADQVTRRSHEFKEQILDSDSRSTQGSVISLYYNLKPIEINASSAKKTQTQIINNMAKIKVSLLLCAFFLIGQYTLAQQIKRVVKAVLEYQDFTTTTIEDVHCEDFKATFGDSIRKIEIDNDSTLKCITKYALHFVEARKKPLDVRVLLTIFYNESKQEYCMNRFGLFYNPESGKYYKNEYLYKDIVDRCL